MLRRIRDRESCWKRADPNALFEHTPGAQCDGHLWIFDEDPESRQEFPESLLYMDSRWVFDLGEDRPRPRSPRKIRMDLVELEKITAAGESETVEFKKSTGQLTRAGETLCAFLNGQGGRVFIGVTPEGKVVGQQIADATLREVAVALARFEPPALISQERITLANGSEILVLSAPAVPETGPFTFEGRAYQRVGSTTSILPQARYEALLLERTHGRARWENALAPDVTLRQLDREEILRTVRLGIEAGRLPESTGGNIGDILDRLRLREQGKLLNAAVILFGKESLPGYPQRQLRLARFKGTDKSEFLDNRQPRGHAFALLDEAMTFLHRHLPIRGRFESGRLERIDELLFPTAALREALVNAFCHRDYAIWGGAVNVAIFDDRVEIWSDGTLPFGIRPEDLKRDHVSKPRNPYITDVFYRRGLVEQWGRGTNRIVEMTVQSGNPEPEFEEIAGSVVVRFRPQAGTVNPKFTEPPGSQSAPGQAQVKAHDKAHDEAHEPMTEVEQKLLAACADAPKSATQLLQHLGYRGRTGNFKKALSRLLARGFLEMTLPTKARSRLQKYRLTDKGGAWLADQTRFPGAF